MLTVSAENGGTAHVDLFWIPLGAGDAVPCVRWNGRLFEALAARRDHRPAQLLFHAALEVQLDAERYALELAPAWGGAPVDRGVVCEGPVGLAWLGRSRFFRYEVRRWSGGVIPDAAYAVGGPRRMTDDPAVVEQVLALAPAFPTLTWGRDEQGTGDMWNSNSFVSWLLTRSGLDLRLVSPPEHGRAPGWAAGLAVAGRNVGAEACGHRRFRPRLLGQQLLAQDVGVPAVLGQLAQHVEVDPAQRKPAASVPVDDVVHPE